LLSRDAAMKLRYRSRRPTAVCSFLVPSLPSPCWTSALTTSFHRIITLAHSSPHALILAITPMGTRLDTVADLIEYAQCYFPEAYAKLPVPKPSLLVDFRCTCCSVQFEGIYIGQAFVKDIHGPYTNHDDVVKMVATFGAHCGQDIRVTSGS
jgi:hypothetical protein